MGIGVSNELRVPFWGLHHKELCSNRPAMETTICFSGLRGDSTF